MRADSARSLDGLGGAAVLRDRAGRDHDATQGPGPAAQGVAGLRGMFGMTESVRVVRRWIDGGDVITGWELQFDGVTMAVVN